MYNLETGMLTVPVFVFLMSNVPSPNDSNSLKADNAPVLYPWFLNFFAYNKAVRCKFFPGSLRQYDEVIDSEITLSPPSMMPRIIGTIYVGHNSSV